MSKISLKGVNTKRFVNLIKRSASLDNLIFITLKGNQFESTAYNKNKSALKSVYADLEMMCEEFENPIDDAVKIQFSNANKLIQVLSLVGADSVDVIFDIEDNNYAKKALVKNSDTAINVSCADKEAVDFLEIPENARHSIFEDSSKLQYSINVSDAEFKYMSSLFNLNKDTVRVFFNLIDGDVYVSEIESTDENVRQAVNEIIQDKKYDEFESFEKLYSKKLTISEYNNVSGDDKYLGCFNKSYFGWIDNDDNYTFEYHTNKIKIVSYDEESGIKTYVVLTPVRFA